MADRHNQFRPMSNGFDGYHYDASQGDYGGYATGGGGGGPTPLSAVGGFGDFAGYAPPSTNSNFFGGFPPQHQQPNGVGYPGQRGGQQQQQRSGGSRGFNPDAPSFQPRQRTSPQGGGSYHQQQPQRQANPAGFGYNPFGYQNTRQGGFNPHQQHQSRAPLPYAQVVASMPQGAPHMGAPFHHRHPGPPAAFDAMMHMPMMSGAFGEPAADAYGYDSFGADAAAMSNTVTSQYTLSEELIDRMQTSANKSGLFEVQIGLEQLICESQEFDTWAPAIKDRLLAKEMLPEDISLAASLIVEMAVLGNGCQYNFARLCQLLQQNMSTFAVGHLKPSLVEFCHVKAPELAVDPLRNLTSFLAEVYEKIEVNGYRVMEFALRLVEQVQRLVQMQPLHDGVVKTIVQAFKLVGRYLEEDQGPESVDQLITALSDAAANSREISESAKNQIRQVKQLREQQWGVQKAEHIQSNYTLPATTTSNGRSTDVLIFGPDGMPLTEEEAAFLEECAAFDSSPAYSGADGDLDGEMLEDYEQFLRDQTEATAIRIAEKALEKLSVDEDDIPDTPKQTPEKPNPLSDDGGPPLNGGASGNKRSA